MRLNSKNASSRRGVVVLSVVAVMSGLTLTAPHAAADATVISADFGGGSWEPFVVSGGAMLSIEAVDGDNALRVSGRSQDFDGVATSASTFVAGATYNLSMDIRLTEDDARAAARLVGVPGYTWLGNTDVTGADWSTISATWTVPADADAAEAKVYVGTDDIDNLDSYDYLVDNFVVTTAASDDTTVSNDFENDLSPWTVRGSGAAEAQLTTEAHTGSAAALVVGRDAPWNGLAAPIAGVLGAGAVYDVSAWVKLPKGAAGSADVRMSVQRAIDDGAPDKWVTLTTVSGVTATNWVPIEFSSSIPEDPEVLYFETAEGTADLLVDDIVVTKSVGEVQDLQAIKDTFDFPIGAAIDSRETTGRASELLLKHFNQVTPENHMKPEAWYDEGHNFRPHPQVPVLMDYAQANDLRVYGHVLAWHSQTPDWFFQDDAGRELTNSEADRKFLRERLETHINDIAQYMADEYGGFGSESNPLVAWDVVNEVVSDDNQSDGLRRSKWYRTLGSEFIDLAFEYADKAFNEDYAAEGADRPVALFINDYNTEQDGKQDRYRQVIEGLLDRGVPLDGIGHQFHISVSTPVASLGDVIDRFADLAVTQVVTELDIAVGPPVTRAALISQGHYYRDVFQQFRARSNKLFSVALWGLTDDRSWRSEGGPLAFTSDFQAKPAYFGIVDSEDLPTELQTALVHAEEVPLTTMGAQDPLWRNAPMHPIGDAGELQLRWSPDHLTVLVQVIGGADKVTLYWGDESTTVERGGTDGAVVIEREGGWAILAQLPAALAATEQVPFDVSIAHGDDETEWAPGPGLGSLTLVEELSVVDVVPATDAPIVDGRAEDAWAAATSVSTDKVIEGEESAATATVRTMWHGSKLYVFADVTDSALDATASDPWVQDSVEVFLDLGNAKNGPYRPEDAQIRINLDNELSFGAGDEAEQRARVESAATRTTSGYAVEAAFDLGDLGGADTVQGVDFQVNDGVDGQRVGVRSWADPTGQGYQNTSRWGVARLLSAKAPEPTPSPSTSQNPSSSPSPGPSSPTTEPSALPTATVTVTAPAVKGDLYSTPGFHRVNGRNWFTTCEPYSQTVRCTTKIWATTAARSVSGQYVNRNGWVFNNLTYLPLMTRAAWGANPLARTGEFVSDERRWRTECDTAATGRNGCRSYIWSKNAVSSTPRAGGGYTYRLGDKWVFNNMVRFG